MPVVLPRWTVDLTRSPIVVLHVEGEGDGPPDLDSFLAIGDALLARGERLGVVIDLARARPDAMRRRRIIEWTDRHERLLRERIAACAPVAPTAFHRGFITAITWIKRPIVPLEPFATREAAIAWLRGRMG